MYQLLLAAAYIAFIMYNLYNVLTMAKKTSEVIFRCTVCQAVQPRWLGRCPVCGEWNSIEEQIVRSYSKGFDGKGTSGEKSTPVTLAEVSATGGERLSTGLAELDRVLGGGAELRSAILAGGEPGIGKSTLMLQAAAMIASRLGAGSVLYVSGEESPSQIKNRALRLGISDAPISLLTTSRLDDVMDALDAKKGGESSKGILKGTGEEKTALETHGKTRKTSAALPLPANAKHIKGGAPKFVVVDSIQTMTAQVEGVTGPVTQLRYCAMELISWVKSHDSVLVMTAHVTKEGDIAGPKILEHMVDTVAMFERTSDDVRFLRTEKNRFGSIDELGIFAMTEKGLEEVGDPSSLFITRRDTAQPEGVVCTVVAEGTRAFMVEVQALTVAAKGAQSRVYSDRVESNKVSRVAAVLEKRTGLVFSDQDIYINIAGGIRIKDSAADAAIAAALYSARTGVAIDAFTAVIGELSLAGEIRPVNRLAQRVKAAKSMGYERIFSPDEAEGAIKVSSLSDFVRKAFS